MGSRRFSALTAAAVLVGALLSGTPGATAAPADVAEDVRAAAKTSTVTGTSEAATRVQRAADALRARSAAARAVCYEAHLQDIGWQGVRCNGQVAGTTGQSRRLEAIVIAVSSDVGSVCYEAHLQDIGWQGVRCNGQVAGTTGQSRRLEAIAIAVSSGNVCYQAHLQDIGWESVRCNGQVAGTTGQSRRLEAISIAV